MKIVTVSPEDVVLAGIEVRQARQERKMSQRAVAKATGMDTTTVGRIERGEVKEPTKLVVLQRFFHTGKYKHDADPVDDLDMHALTDHQLYVMLEKAGAEVVARGHDPVDDLDMTALSDRRLFTILEKASAEIAARFSDGDDDDDDGPSKRHATRGRRAVAASSPQEKEITWARKPVPGVTWSHPGEDRDRKSAR